MPSSFVVDLLLLILFFTFPPWRTTAGAVVRFYCRLVWHHLFISAAPSSRKHSVKVHPQQLLFLTLRLTVGRSTTTRCKARVTLRAKTKCPHHASTNVCIVFFQLVRDRLVEHRQKEKASYGGLFDKGPMYNDKEVREQTRRFCVLQGIFAWKPLFDLWGPSCVAFLFFSFVTYFLAVCFCANLPLGRS